MTAHSGGPHLQCQSAFALQRQRSGGKLQSHTGNEDNMEINRICTPMGDQKKKFISLPPIRLHIISAGRWTAADLIIDRCTKPKTTQIMTLSPEIPSSQLRKTKPHNFHSHKWGHNCLSAGVYPSR